MVVPQPLGVWGLGLPTRVQSVPEKTGVCVETLELRTHPLARENLSIYIFFSLGMEGSGENLVECSRADYLVSHQLKILHF